MWVYGVLGTACLTPATLFLFPAGDVVVAFEDRGLHFLGVLVPVSFLIIFIAFSLVQTFSACTSIGKAFFFSAVHLLFSILVIFSFWSFVTTVYLLISGQLS